MNRCTALSLTFYLMILILFGLDKAFSASQGFQIVGDYFNSVVTYLYKEQNLISSSEFAKLKIEINTLLCHTSHF